MKPTEDQRKRALEELQEAVDKGTICRVHGGRTWKGGYCDKWTTDTGKGPCVEVSDRFDSIMLDEPSEECGGGER